MQYRTDVDLAAAIAAPQRSITVLLEFDWNRDGTFSHTYTDLSTLAQTISSDAQLQTDLPDVVNTITGHASRGMKTTLAGSRAPDEFDVTELFSPYLPDSPLYAFTVPGTPVRYSRVVQTESGPRTVRQFTGTVRSFSIDRAAGEVQLDATDVADIVGSMVTLPHWAAYIGEFTPSRRPISSTWVIEEVLAQVGRATGPTPRSDAFAYVSCNGSFIPSVGSFADSRLVNAMRHTITFQNSPPFAAGKYGLAPRIVWPPQNPTLYDYRNGSQFGSTRYWAVPIDNGDTSQTQVNPCIAAWVYSDGTTTSGDFDEWSRPHLHAHAHIEGTEMNDSRTGGYGRDGGVTMNVWRDGTLLCSIVESEERSDQRAWRFYRNAPLSKGWHYVAVEFRMLSNSITAVLRVDDVEQPWTTISRAPGGYRYVKYPDGGRKQWVTLIANIPAQHVQWWVVGGAAGGQYRAGQQHPQLTADGRPRAYVTSGTLSEMSWLPDCYLTSGWDVLQEVCSAEFAALHTDEHGSIHYMPHYILRRDAASGIATPIPIDDDRLLSFTVNPSDDHYRNMVSMSYSDRRAIRSLLYESGDPWEFYGYTGTGPSKAYPDLPLTESIALYQEAIPHDLDAVAPNGGPSVYTGLAAACTWWGSMYNPDNVLLADNVWSVGAYVDNDQRSFRLELYSPRQWIFLAYLPGNQPALHVAGWKYSENKYTRKVYQNGAEVTKRGVRLIELDDNPWRQTVDTANAIAADLLADTITPAPLVEDVSIPADPRLQLRDVVKLTSDNGITGAVFGQIIGMDRTDERDGGSLDTLTLRLLVTPGEWILDDANLSILDETTILS